jgi:hypothetical protein
MHSVRYEKAVCGNTVSRPHETLKSQDVPYIKVFLFGLNTIRTYGVKTRSNFGGHFQGKLLLVGAGNRVYVIKIIFSQQNVAIIRIHLYS